MHDKQSQPCDKCLIMYCTVSQQLIYVLINVRAVDNKTSCEHPDRVSGG